MFVIRTLVMLRSFRVAALLTAILIGAAPAAGFEGATDVGKYSEEAVQAQLHDASVVETGVLVPMRDGVGLATSVFRPRSGEGARPAILWRTPYSELRPMGRTAKMALAAVSRDYVFIVQNERGRYLSQGEFAILGRPETDGYDMLSWIAAQPWSNGKVGTAGCSSSAEWQLALAAQDHPAHAAMVPMSAGAGIGKVGRFQEQGNWYTGGVPRNLFAVWLYTMDNAVSLRTANALSSAMRSRLGEYKLELTKPVIDWKRQLQHLPLNEMFTALGEPPGLFEQRIVRKPADASWLRSGLYDETMDWGVPALWFNSWYDVSIGPNLELFNHLRAAKIDAEASAHQYVVIAPGGHCDYDNLGRHLIVGERSMGDASFDVHGAIFGWFDRWLKGDKRTFPDDTAHVRYFTMGENRWKSDLQWPPATAKPLRLYLRSNGSANSLYGDGQLTPSAPAGREHPDSYTYDPRNPVQTIGGGDCCIIERAPTGAVDQRAAESRSDVLVYTTAPLASDLEVTGEITVNLRVSSSARDTDFAVKIVDVAEDGNALIVADTILRARYRNGYDRIEMMQPGRIYTIKPTPMFTSLRFFKGHRLRLEVTSSNFPKFSRNLNTGGENERESKPVVAVNTVHHSKDDPSYIDLSVVPTDHP